MNQKQNKNIIKKEDITQFVCKKFTGSSKWIGVFIEPPQWITCRLSPAPPDEVLHLYLVFPSKIVPVHQGDKEEAYGVQD